MLDVRRELNVCRFGGARDVVNGFPPTGGTTGAFWLGSAFIADFRNMPIPVVEHEGRANDMSLAEVMESLDAGAV